ncbi:MAG: LAGLIDADG family homing endonuclease [Nanoarchaeota archaeon]
MLDSFKNKKIAESRWDAKIKEEKSKILNTDEATILKAILCGFLAGDGSVQVRKEKSCYHYQLDFFPDDELMMDIYIKAIKKVYQKEPSVRIRDNVFHVRKTSKTIVTDLLELTRFETKLWSIPKFVLDCKKTKVAWLKAFFSAEAYVNKKSIKIQTVNKTGMGEISKLLDEFQIKHRTYEYQPKKKNHSRVYIIFIGPKSERKKYYEEIGFYHSKKNKILKTAAL